MANLIYFIIILIFELSLAEQQSTCKREGTRCDDWVHFFPEKDNSNFCNMEVSRLSIETFKYLVLVRNANLVRLKLRFYSNGSEYVPSICVLQPYRWVWTYDGIGGARQYLNWPMEYSTWSLGLLDAQTVKSLKIRIKVSDNCCVSIGNKNTTGGIAIAFKQIAENLNKSEGNGNYKSYFCYKSRFYLHPFVYSLCKHIICPIEAIGYRCCKYVWDKHQLKKVMSCPGIKYSFFSMWWLIPFFAGIVLYLYIPIVLLKLGDGLKSGIEQHIALNKMQRASLNGYESINSQEDDIASCDTGDTHADQYWIFENPITVAGILSRPFRCCIIKFPLLSSRFIRFIISIMTMLIVCLKIVLHWMFQYEFIVDSVENGVPMDFLSVLAGYKLSRMNFMVHLGGPYVACTFYLLMLTVFLCLPKDLPGFMLKNFPDNPAVSVSPLTLDLTMKLRYGSIYGYRSIIGYKRIYKTMIFHFVMLLGPQFWKQVYKIQRDRWNGIISNIETLPCIVVSCIFGFPFYIIACVLEIILCILYYGFPIFFFIHVILRAYYVPIWRKFKFSNFLTRCFGRFLVTVVSCMILFVFYINSIVFLTSFVFVFRVLVFTYSSLFAHPGLSFGYVIFGFSMLLYGSDSVKAVKRVYDDLFERTLSHCKTIHDENPRSKVQLFKIVKGYTGIPRELFRFVLDKHRPIRVEIFVSSLKILVLSLVLFLSVSLLRSFSGQHNVHILTESISTLFVCMIPKFLKEICVFDASRENREFDWVLLDTIRDYTVMKQLAEDPNRNEEIVGASIDR